MNETKYKTKLRNTENDIYIFFLSFIGFILFQNNEGSILSIVSREIYIAILVGFTTINICSGLAIFISKCRE